VVTVVKIKPVTYPQHGEVTIYAQDMVHGIDAKMLEERNRTLAISLVSSLLQQKFPILPRETRRRVAARCLEEERKRRKENNHAT
jgi:hypothetical protein